MPEEIMEQAEEIQQEEIVESEEIISEEVVESEEVASLTFDDIGQMIHEQLDRKCDPPMYPAYIFPEEHIIWARNWHMKDLEYMECEYSVDGNVVSLGEMKPIELVAVPKNFNELMSEKDSAIAEASIKINEYKETISSLEFYKSEFEKMEAEKEELAKCKKRKALCEYAIKSGLITEEELSSDETIAAYIENIDESAIKQIIADRFMNSINKSSVETSETTVVSKAVIENDEVQKVNIAMMFANKKKN